MPPRCREAPVESHTAHNQPSLLHVKRKANKKINRFSVLPLHVRRFSSTIVVCDYTQKFLMISWFHPEHLRSFFPLPRPHRTSEWVTLSWSEFRVKRFSAFSEAGVNNARHRNYGTKLCGWETLQGVGNWVCGSWYVRFRWLMWRKAFIAKCLLFESATSKFWIKLSVASTKCKYFKNNVLRSQSPHWFF